MRDYNFFSIYSKKHKQGIDFKAPYMIGFLVVVLFVLLTAGVIVRNMLVENQIQGLQTQIVQIKESSAYTEAEKLRINIQTMQMYDKNAQTVLEKFAEAKILNTSLLEEIAKTVPAGVRITGMAANNTVLQIACTAATRKAAAEFQLHLKELPHFQEVHMSSVALVAGAGFTAGIECILVKAGEEE